MARTRSRVERVSWWKALLDLSLPLRDTAVLVSPGRQESGVRFGALPHDGLVDAETESRSRRPTTANSREVK